MNFNFFLNSLKPFDIFFNGFDRILKNLFTHFDRILRKFFTYFDRIIRIQKYLGLPKLYFKNI